MKLINFKRIALKILIINLFSLSIPIEFLSKDILAQNYEELNPEYLKQRPYFNDYILGPGDTIKVDVTSEKYQSYTTKNNLNSIYTINGEGLANFKRLNKIYIEGLTVKELEKLLNEEYAKYVNKPDLNIEIISYRPVKVYVEGEVNVPGVYILSGSTNLNAAELPENQLENISESDEYLKSILQTNEINFSKFIFPTVFDVIRRSDGITRLSDLNDIEIIRRNPLSNGGGFIKTSISLYDVLDNFNSNQNIRIFDGDKVIVKKAKEPVLNQVSKAIKSNLNPRTMNVFVSGRVEQGGLIEVPKSSTLSDAIDIAGGAKAIRGPVRFLRINSDGKFEKRIFNYKSSRRRGSYQNPYLREGDLIVVGKNKLNVANEILNDLTSPFIGIYSTIGVIKEISD